MKLVFIILTIIVLLLSVVPIFTLPACQRSYQACHSNTDCCKVPSRRMVCAPYQKQCGKKKCCITEVEEQEEKQAAIIRDRNPKLRQLLDLLLNEIEEEEE